MHNTEERLSLVLSQQLTREDPAMKGAPSSFAFSTIHSASCQLYELRHTAPPVTDSKAQPGLARRH